MTDASASLRRFAGFPAGARATAVPSVVFSELMPILDNADELRVTLYVVYALGRRKGYPRFVTANELRAEAPLMASLGDGCSEEAVERLEHALAGAAERGTLICLEMERDGRAERLYALNSPADRRAFERMEAERTASRPLTAVSEAPASERANVYRMYEENIGPLTPLVAEELKEAERLYPLEWLEEAFREAAVLNKRSWRYVARILERWATEGRSSAKAGRAAAEGDSARAQLLRRYRQAAGDS